MALKRLAMITQEADGWQVPDWRRLQADLITDVAALCEALNLRPEQVPGGVDADSDFPLRVPRRYLSRIEPGNPDDPLLRQVLASAREREPVPGYGPDPLEEAAHTPVPGLLHKYHGRALLVVTGACAVHCRYCFRRHFPYQTHLSGGRWKQALDWLRAHPDIREVILSGGDPLTLSNERLAGLLEELAAIPHLDRLRFHTRTPVVIPERLDDGLLALLDTPRWRVTLVLHANHPREIDPDLSGRCRALARAGVTLLNQAVLLAGVNDRVETLAALSDALHDAGVLPYYLHQLDAVAGAAHFAVPDPRAFALHQALRARLPGFLVPRLAREEPGESGKTVLKG
ncbi:MAG: EF-P beta-lysylation protein EpmB [Alcanivorax sp.]|nr:EF-P beta-lysylation protein EpmB [Alcanivorax sp.]